MERHIPRRGVLAGGGGLLAAGLALSPRTVLSAGRAAATERPSAGAVDVLAAYRLTAPQGARDMQPAVFSHEFAQGEVPAGFHAEPRLAVDLPLLAWEAEVEQHPDGSWKAARYLIELPRLNPGDSVVLELRARAGESRRQPVDPLGLHKGREAPVSAAALIGYAPPDGGAEAADALRPGEWSGDLQRNNYQDANPDPDERSGYWFMPRSPTRSVVNSYARNLAYGNGVWMPDRLRFVLTGGGHGDWAGSEILAFDLRSLRWVRTDDSCRYCGDETWDGTSLSQWDSPCRDRDSKVADTFIPATRMSEKGQIPWYPWPNIRGRRGPVSTHTYGYMAHDAATGRIWHFGTALWPGSGGYNGGLWAIDPDTLTWDHDNTLALPAPGPGYDGTMRALGGGRVLLHTGGKRTLRVIDVESGRAADTTEPEGQYQGANLFVADDPDDPGHKAAFHSHTDSGQGFIKQPRCRLFPDEPGYRLSLHVPFRTSRPEAIHARARPVVMGDHGRNPAQVVFFAPRADGQPGGLAIYDTKARAWTEVPVEVPEVGTFYLFQGFDYIPAYDAFALSTRAPDSRTASRILLLKRPAMVD